MIPPPGPLLPALEAALATGRRRIGQIVIEGDGPFCLRHADDLAQPPSPSQVPAPAPPQIFHGPDAALDLARLDDAGNYRPLRSAPNLRHGWELVLKDLGELHRALDLFYPAALGLWLLGRDQNLPTQPLRQKLERQTGMYRSTRFLTPAAAQTLIAHLCQRGCLKHILWPISADSPAPEPPNPADSPTAIPLYCPEACNLFVSKARQAVLAEAKNKQG